MYNEKVMKIFRNPKHMGSIKNADAIGTVGNPRCGDIMKIYLKIKDKIIIDIKVETFGCVSAIATSSILAGLVKGKTIEEAKKITFQDIVTELGGLPKIKMHCSHLAINTLKQAIKNYEKK